MNYIYLNGMKIRYHSYAVKKYNGITLLQRFGNAVAI